MATDINIIFEWFETGDEPTQEQFRQTFLSFFHKNDGIPMSQIIGLSDALDAKAEKELLDIHLTAPDAHANILSELLSRRDRRFSFTPNEDTSIIQFEDLKQSEFDAICYKNTYITDDIVLDSETGTLSNWDFYAGTKYIIFYTKL